MKKSFSFITTSLFALTLSSSVFAADTGTGSINFTGKIINAACAVSINGNKDNAVNLGQWPTSTFKAVGDKTIPQPFTLDITECVPGTFKFNFTGAVESGEPNLLKVSAAQGVGIAIANADANGTQVNLNTNAGTESNANLIIATGQTVGSLPLQAYYQSTQAAVTAGEANATVRVTLQQK